MAKLKKCIVAPDSFKGTLSSIEVCRVMEKTIRKVFPECQVKCFPVADGGEGTVDCFLNALGAEKKTVLTTGPYHETLEAYYALSGKRAILEMAQVAGLPQVEGRMDPRRTTTYGLGQLIRSAIEEHCTEIIIGLGGSCTNDAGIGTAMALGVKFYDEHGQEFMPYADEMTRICHVDISEAQKLLKDCHITAMCDINNPMYGKNGAAYVFAPQKGADEETVELLDQNLRALSEVIKKDLGIDVSQIPGAGAAGALGAGIVAFLGGELKSGIETVLNVVNFDDELKDTQLIFTGEGKVDSQSFDGKVLSGITSRAEKAGVPVVVVAGSVDDSADAAYGIGVYGTFSINRMAVDFSVSRDKSHENLERTMEAILRLYSIV